MVITVFNSEFCWFTVMVWLVGIWNAGSEWKPLEESSDLWAFVMRINWKTQMIMDAVIEGG
jgi:hypothetical protein